MSKISDFFRNNLTETASGFALDARQGKALQDEITALKNETYLMFGQHLDDYVFIRGAVWANSMSITVMTGSYKNYVRLPNGMVVSGGLNTTGLTPTQMPAYVPPGLMLIAIHKNETSFEIDDNSSSVKLSGDLIFPVCSLQNITMSTHALTSVDLSSITTITQLNFAINSANIYINLGSNSNVNLIILGGCQQSAAVIASLLAKLVTFPTISGSKTLILGSGTNAAYSTWSTQAKADCTTLEGRGWAIMRNS